MNNFVGRASISMDVSTLVSAIGMEAAEEMVFKIMSTIEQSAKAVFIDSTGNPHTFGVDHIEFEVEDIREQDEEEDCKQWAFDLEKAYKK
jgi:hypothetical protein